MSVDQLIPDLAALGLYPGGKHPGVRTAFTTYYTSATQTPSSTTGALVANRGYYVPIYLPGCTVDRIGVNVTTGSAGALRLGIYNSTKTGMPGSLIVDAGTVDTTSIATVEATITSLLLPNDWIWLYGISNATATVTMGTPANTSIMGATNLTAAHSCLMVSGTYGALPATAAAPTTTVLGAPMIFLRKS